MSRPFWETVPLHQMTSEQWESLCDGCGRCCLHKLEDEDSGEVFYTSIACRLLDTKTCQCSNYPERMRHVPECLKLTVADIPDFHWLPETCAYRLIAKGEPLREWHPLVSGNKQSIHDSGVSVRKIAIEESRVAEEDWEDHLIELINL
ncbi:YcgN family cysteine cluster protein [Endozoicomonas sp. OPT23]|uniref:YcgN family cysteine cluster protein n=1 Tax=Endozoicomonas sp. OPT23 TaxID=2072845 RepID=UPI00129C0DF2|nr:YcgN family cysteine cluster protein [Endozoicomonas sp. OPT23]MRI32364.1 YcgN family cysteine cluster protein [Endozoicomonas sp. OPT23]